MLDALSHRIRSPSLGSLAAVLAAHALLIGVMTLQGSQRAAVSGPQALYGAVSQRRAGARAAASRAAARSETAAAHRVTDVCGHKPEIGSTVSIRRDPGAVVCDQKVMLAALPASGDRSHERPRRCCSRQLRNRLQWVTLGKCDDGDGVPFVANA